MVQEPAENPNASYFDVALHKSVTYKCLLLLHKCPIDVWFTAAGTGLHGSSLASLCRKGYLNSETAFGITEYYLNNHGHRLRARTLRYARRNPPPLESDST